MATDRFDQTLPPGLEELTPSFVNDLRDLVANYGAEVRGIAGLRRMILPTPTPAQVTVTVPPSKMGNISLRPVPVDGDTSMICIMVLDDAARSYIQWDRRVTSAQVAAAMAAVDAEMAHCRDPLTGRRRRVTCDQYAPPPLSVDRYFDRRGKVMVLDEGIDPDTMRYQFDRPDDLAVLDDVGGKKGRRGLCRRTDVVREARRDDVTSAVLAKYGVRGQAQIDRMSKERLTQMLAEIEAELDKPQ